VTRSGHSRFSVNQWSREWRSWRTLQLVGMALLTMVAVTVCVAEFAGAAPTEGQSVPDSAVPVGTFTAGQPFSSGQLINVVVPTNSLFVANTNVNILECSAPNGVIPISPNACDGDTIQGPSVAPNADGSINYQSATSSLYPVFFTPDSAIGDTASSPACGNTAATECILFIGDNQGDFTQPHVWSQPFFVTPTPGDTGTDPGDGSAPVAPTVPSASLSTVTVSPQSVTADGVDQSSVTVTLLGSGSVPVAGKTVTLTGGTGHASIAPASSGSNVTNSSGVATFSVTDATVETVTLTATDTTDPVLLTAQPTVTFVTPVVTPASSGITVGTVSGGSATVTVTLRDQAADPQPVVGQTVSVTGTGSVVITPASSGSDVTNSSGVATFTTTDSQSESVTLTANDTTPSTAILIGTTSVTFGTGSSPPTPSPTISTVVVSRSSAPADGHTEVLVIVTINDQYGNPLAGKVVWLRSSPSQTLQIKPIAFGNASPGVSDDSGIAEFAATDTAVEVVTFSAYDCTNHFTVQSQPSVSFQTPVSPPAVTPEVATQTLLPLSALAIGGLAYFARRRRRRQPDEGAAPPRPTVR
jgi:hypothetical protein